MSANPTSRSRQPAGTPVGGQFAPEPHAEPEVALDATPPAQPSDARREVDADGTIRWYDDAGDLHRDGGPAIERPDGTKEWLYRGQRHRDDGPAVEFSDGYRAWYQYGERHRDDGPAIERPDGTKEWLYRGQRHRDDGPAVEWASGRQEWWTTGRWVATGDSPSGGGSFTWRAPDGSTFTYAGYDDEPWGWANVAQVVGPFEARDLYEEADGSLGRAMAAAVRRDALARGVDLSGSAGPSAPDDVDYMRMSADLDYGRRLGDDPPPDYIPVV